MTEPRWHHRDAVRVSVATTLGRSVLSYLFAAAVVTVALVVKIAFASLGQDHPFLLLPTAVIIATWYGGGGPGLFATTLCAVGADVLFLPPAGFGTTPSDLFALLVMLVEGFVIVFVTDSLREARREAAEHGLEADRAHRSVAFSLSVRDELLGLWVQKLSGPLGHVRAAGQEARRAVETGDADAARKALERLEADIDLLQRTTTATLDAGTARAPPTAAPSTCRSRRADAPGIAARWSASGRRYAPRTTAASSARSATICSATSRTTCHAGVRCRLHADALATRYAARFGLRLL